MKYITFDANLEGESREFVIPKIWLRYLQRKEDVHLAVIKYHFGSDSEGTQVSYSVTPQTFCRLKKELMDEVNITRDAEQESERINNPIDSLEVE